MAMRCRARIALVLCTFLTMLTGLATGLALACTGNYCNGSVSGCTRLYDSVQDSCCVDLDHDGISHCATCTRDRWFCGSSVVLGPAYNCSGSGAFCS